MQLMAGFKAALQASLPLTTAHPLRLAGRNLGKLRMSAESGKKKIEQGDLVEVRTQ
jgi:hypothetical protein